MLISKGYLISALLAAVFLESHIAEAIRLHQIQRVGRKFAGFVAALWYAKHDYKILS